MMELIYLYIQLHALQTRDVAHKMTMYCDTHTNLFNLKCQYDDPQVTISRPVQDIRSTPTANRKK